jgi:Holliday junction DNA helicase RuvB
MPDRVVTNQLTDDERGLEAALRPQTLDEHIGQERMKESSASASRRQSVAARRWTMRFSTASRTRKDDHRPHYCSRWGWPSAPPQGWCWPMLEIWRHSHQSARTDVLFIDEIHRLPASVEEALYPAMEDY